MTFFGTEVVPGKVTWVDASTEAPIRLTNACLLKRARRKAARVVLQVCAEPDSPSEDVFSVAMGVLVAPHAENAHLDVLLNSRMGLRLAGPDSAGAVVHVVGNVLLPADEYDSDDEDMSFPAGLDVVLDGNRFVIQEKDDGSENEDEELSDSQEEESDEDEKDKSMPDAEQVAEEKAPPQPTVAAKRSRKGDGNEKMEEEKPARDVKGKSGGLPMVTHRSGLKFQELVVGSGKRVVKGHNVAIRYVLRLENGKVVDRADRKRPFKFRLGIGECVKGFDIGVSGMKEGGERHLIVPPHLGYGTHPPPGIPRNATLYFDVGVVKAF